MPSKIFGLAEPRPTGHDPKVAGQCQLETTPKGAAGNGSHGGPRQCGEGVQDLCKSPGHLAGACPALELGDVGAGREDTVHARDEDRPGEVDGECLNRLAELSQQTYR